MLRYLLNRKLKSSGVQRVYLTTKRRANRLAQEKSPYLQQHQHNPVDWYPWGTEAFEKARVEQKPIFLSVGYSTCHWCHVMERESFEDFDIAEILNENFVSIKVDREERPDVDKVYMTFIQATTRRGGWPMSVWLTPHLKPFTGGTYFPPTQKWGQMGFKEVLLKIDRLWKSDKEKIMKTSDNITQQLEGSGLSNYPYDRDAERAGFLSEIFSSYFKRLSSTYDRNLGGFGSAPKFPRPSIFTGLYHCYHNNSGYSGEALEMTEFTLQQMFQGGMHDHLGGGFHRYSVDASWHVPHFEKMLYDQAQLASAHVTAYQITGKKIYQQAACDILDYVIGDLRSPHGGFYSAEDADSKLDHNSEDHAEGAFYVWELSELDSILGIDAPPFIYHFGVEENGNAPYGSDPHGEFINKNILIQMHSVLETATKFGKSEEEMIDLLSRAKKLLLTHRSLRPRPFLDDKIITSWNGLTISALARASCVFQNEKYLEAAVSAVDFIHENLYQNGKLLRNFKDGASNILGFADDYAFFITGLLDLYQAINLQETMDMLFYDSVSGGYFNSSKDRDDLIVRLKEEYDGAEPSATSYGCNNLMRLYYITKNESYREKVATTINSYSQTLIANPDVFPHLLSATNLFFGPPEHVLVEGDPTSPTFRNMLDVIHSKFNPFLVLLFITCESDLKYLKEDLALPYLQHHVGKETCSVTVCKDFACSLPVTDVNVLERLLKE